MAEFLLPALFIFSMRVVDASLYTLRIMMVARGRKELAWVFAFFQSAIFITVVSTVLRDFGNWGKMIGYSAGFATGMVVGMWVEDRLGVGYTHFRIVSSHHGAIIAERLRESGYAVTELAAVGRDGTVSLLNCFVFRSASEEVGQLIIEEDPEAFVTSEAVRPLYRGYWRRRGRRRLSVLE